MNFFFAISHEKSPLLLAHRILTSSERHGGRKKVSQILLSEFYMYAQYILT